MVLGSGNDIFLLPNYFGAIPNMLEVIFNVSVSSFFNKLIEVDFKVSNEN